MRLSRVPLYILLLEALALVSALGAFAAGVTRTERYFVDATGKPFYFVGYYGSGAVAVGYYTDQPTRLIDIINQDAPYGLCYMRMGAGNSHLTGTTNPPSWDGRETPTGFLYVNNKADLDQWDDRAWSGLQYHLDLARQKGIFVQVKFFEGTQIKAGTQSYRWDNNYWNIDNQARSFYGDLDVNNNGSAEEDGDFYRLNDFLNNTGVGYYQRRFIDKILSVAEAYDNVFYEVGNELFHAPASWYQAVIDYVRSRSTKPVTINGGGTPLNLDGRCDHRGDTPSAVKSLVANNVGNGHPFVVDPDGSALLGGSSDDLRRAAWYTFVGGGAGWGGFTTDFKNGAFNTTTATYYKNLIQFTRNSGAKFWRMVPAHSLVGNNSENSCLAKAGSEYIAYILNDSSATLDLGAVSGTAYYKLYNPKTAAWSSAQTVSGGAVRTFSKPSGADDWVIWVYLNLPQDTQPPSVPSGVQATPLSHTSVKVTWAASTDNVGVMGYKVYRNGSQVGTSTATSYTNTGLTPNTMYSYAICAYDDSLNNSALSAPATATTPPAPISADGDTYTYSDATYSGGSDCCNNPSGCTGYACSECGKAHNAAGIQVKRFCYAPLNAFTHRNGWVQFTLGAVLVSAATLKMYQTAINTDSNSNTVRLEAKESSFNEAALTWNNQPSDADPWPGAETLGEWVVPVDPAAQRWYGLDISRFYNAHLGKTVTIRLKTVSCTNCDYFGPIFEDRENSQGSGNAPRIEWYGDAQSPSAPANVRASALTPKAIKVSWGASTDNVGVAGYKVYRDDAQIATTSATTCTDTGLQAGTSYNYSVSAYDWTANESALSDAAVGSTPPVMEVQDVKDAPGGTTVGLVGKTVTAVFSTFFYIEESERHTGIRVVPLVMPAAIGVGSAVDVGGTLQTANGERFVGAAGVEVYP